MLLGFNLALVGWWTHSVAATAVLGALGFACVVGAIAAILPVAQAVIPPQTRAQGFGAFINSLFIGAFVAGAPLVDFWPELERQHTALSIVVPFLTVLGAGLMLYGSRFAERDMRRMVEELEEERARADEERAGTEPPLLQVRNVDFSYGPVQVLFDVNIDVRRGETLAVLGTNGAGKSTLLRVISGLGLPDRGVVRLLDETITYLPAEARSRKGVVQVRGADVFPGLTVRDNLRAALAAHPAERRDAERRIANVFDVFPALSARRNQDAASLSGGEQQMLALGCALLFEPQLLLIDELSLGLAPLVVHSLLDGRRTTQGRGLHDGHRGAVTQHRRGDLGPRHLHREGPHPLRRPHQRARRPRRPRPRRLPRRRRRLRTDAAFTPQLAVRTLPAVRERLARQERR